MREFHLKTVSCARPRWGFGRFPATRRTVVRRLEIRSSRCICASGSNAAKKRRHALDVFKMSPRRGQTRRPRTRQVTRKRGCSPHDRTTGRTGAPKLRRSPFAITNRKVCFVIQTSFLWRRRTANSISALAGLPRPALHRISKSTAKTPSRRTASASQEAICALAPISAMLRARTWRALQARASSRLAVMPR